MLKKCLAVAMVWAAGAGVVLSQDAASFAGQWAGNWRNSLGEKGNSSITLSENSSGQISGTWDGVSVYGKRSNKTAFELTGKNKERSYQMTGTLESGLLTLKYTVTRLNMDGSYSGEATLKRVIK